MCEGDLEKYHCLNCNTSLCLHCMGSLHDLLPQSVSHTVIDSNDKPATDHEDTNGADRNDLHDMPRWFKNACASAEHQGKATMLSGVHQLVPRPGALKSGSTQAGRQKSLCDATNLENNKARKPVNEAAIRAAVLTLSVSESLRWQQSFFVAAAIEMASVFETDDTLLKQVHTMGDNDQAHSKWSLCRRISECMKVVTAFHARNPSNKSGSQTKQPKWTDVAGRLSGFQKNLKQMRAVTNQYTAFSDRYQALAFKYEVMVVYVFCKWCVQQTKQQLGFLETLDAEYAKACKAFHRHPDTPSIAKSWPVEEPAEN